MNHFHHGRASTRFHERAVLIVLGLLVLLVFASLFQGSGSLYFGPQDSDLTAYFYPRMVFLSRWLHRGVLPMWDPTLFSGYPTLEVQQLALFYPPSILPALTLSPQPALLAAMALHLSLALVLGYAGFRKAFRLSPWAALLATVSYVFGAAFIMRAGAGHFTVVAASGWYPLAVGSAFRVAHYMPSLSGGVRAIPSAIRREPLWRWALLGALANAMTVLAGAPQYVVFLFWIEVAAVIAGSSPRRWISSLSALGAVWVMTILLSMPQWLPTLSYLPFTARAAHPSGFLRDPLDRLTFLVELLFPIPFGDDLASPHLSQKNIWETASYPGTVVSVLVFAGLMGLFNRKRRRSARLWAAFGIIVLGVYLIRGNTLPGFGSFRETLKARIVFSFGMSLCAAMAFERLQCSLLRTAPAMRHGIASIRIGAAVVLLAVWGMVAFFVLSPYPISLMFNPDSIPLSPAVARVWKEMTTHPEVLIRLLINAAAAVSIVIGLFLAATLPARRFPRLALMVSLLLACGEPIYWHGRFIHSTHPFPRWGGMPDGVARSLASEVAATRAEGELPWRVAFPNAWINSSYFVDGLLEIGGYDPLIPSGANSRGYLAGFNSTEPPDNYKEMSTNAIGLRYDFVTVKYPEEITPEDLPAFRENESASIAGITRTVLPAEIPLVGFGPNVKGVTGVLPGKARFAREEVEPEDLSDEFRRQVAAIASPHQPERESADTIHLEPQQAPSIYRFDVQLSAPALFILRTTWLPGWRVRVDDDAEATPWIANRWALGVPVQAGSHRVVFEYRPVHLTLALWVASIGWFALLTGWGVLIHREKKRRRACQS